ncbi:MAG TPA: aminotransferase class I/II-fold pyridoxal phosphate-dependent enzyme [Nitrospirota bacterium]|nr:aminotransferase class I/II-fold pyridoxal phosphate-dependent enzyme [Nitrospirota bacterium]
MSHPPNRIEDEQFRTPLFDAMVNLAESRKVSFHTPGHKSGKGISTRFRKFVGPRIFSIDLTTLDEVDSLQNPTGVIKEAQELAARAAGADRSYFLVNGTTVGNHAMVASSTGPGDKVLIARNCHRSVLTGLIMSGAQPVFFQPAFDRDLKLTLNVPFETAKAAIDANLGARALLLTSPNYYGLCADIERIIPYARDKGLLVFVDEAHGPHLKFNPKLPTCALEAGADLCVQSTHKIVGGMTQASMLHARAGRINVDDVTNTLKLLQTTSPSYILMASLDLARMQMATEGKKLLNRTIKLAEDARAEINKIPGIACFGKDRAKQAGMADMDVTKLTITVSDLGLSGYHVSQILNLRFGIQVEMADPFHVLVIVSIGDRQDDLNRLVEALKVISAESGLQGALLPLDRVHPPVLDNRFAMTPRDAFYSDSELVDVRDSAGRVSTEIVTVYPPGIPLLVPGEEISRDALDYLQNMAGLGAIIDGLNENNTLVRVAKS